MCGGLSKMGQIIAALSVLLILAVVSYFTVGRSETNTQKTDQECLDKGGYVLSQTWHKQTNRCLMIKKECINVV